jgi:hypothetical protein
VEKSEDQFTYAMLRQCRAALIHTCHAVPLPFTDSAVSFAKVRVVAGIIRNASSTVYDNKLRGTPRGSRKKPNTGRSPTCRLWTADANQTSHAEPMPSCAVALRSRFQAGMPRARHGSGVSCVNQTEPHCKSNGKDAI